MTRGRPAVVMGLLWAGLAAARSLGRAGLAVHGVAFDGAEFGLRSRYLGDTRVAAGDEEALDALRSFAARGTRPIVFLERDEHVAFVLRNWDAVREVADVPLPDDPAPVERLRHKGRIVAEAERAGVALPATVVPADEDDVRRAALRPPILVKPVEGQEFARRFGGKVFVAQSVPEALDAWRRARDAGFETVLQEVVPDAHDRVFSLFAYVGRTGRPLASVVGRKVRAGPPRFGTAAVLRLCDEPRVLEAGLRLLETAGYRGFAQVELVHDHRDDTFRLLEVNTRPPQWAGIAMTPRFDVARLAYDDLSGRDVEPLEPYTDDGVVWIYLAKDVVSSVELMRRRELGLRGFAREYARPHKVRAIFAADDPLPGVASLAYLATKVA